MSMNGKMKQDIYRVKELAVEFPEGESVVFNAPANGGVAAQVDGVGTLIVLEVHDIGTDDARNVFRALYADGEWSRVLMPPAEKLKTITVAQAVELPRFPGKG